MRRELAYDLGFVLIYIWAFGVSQLVLERYAPGHKKQMIFYAVCFIIGIAIVLGWIVPIDPEASPIDE
jgi:hypothetical protein